jgi:nitrite reductase/ring-hydroxylating ferredoxin subunit
VVAFLVTTSIIRLMPKVLIGSVEQFINSRAIVSLENVKIVVIKRNSHFFAIESICPHSGGI